MKITVIKYAMCLLGSQACFGLLSSSGADLPAASPRIEVSVESDLKTLAQGFVAAFAEFPAGPKYVWIRRGDETVVLGSARTLKAFGGVLAIQVESGPTYLVSASDVVQITNEKLAPAKP